MNNRVPCKHPFLAGFLAFLLFWSLLVTGTFFALKGGIFAGSNIREMMMANGIDKLFYEFCDDIIDEQFAEEDLKWLLENEKFDEIKEEMVTIFFDSLFEEQKSVDLDDITDKIMDAFEAESDIIVDDVFEEIEKEAENFDAANNEKIQSIINTYGIEVDDDFYAELNEYAKDIDNLDEYKDDIKEEIDKQVIEPAREKEDDFKVKFEESYMEMLNEYYGSEGFTTVEQVNDALRLGNAIVNTIAFGGLAVSLFLMFVILLLNKDAVFGAFSKLAIVSGISGFLILFTGLIKFFMDALLNGVLGEDLKSANEELGIDIANYLSELMGMIFNPFIYVGIILIAIMIISIVIWRISKTNYKNRIASEQMYYYGQGMR